jgi:hypothetical protein
MLAGFSAGQARGLGGGYAGLVALGSTQDNAAPITASMHVVTGADATKGVRLVAEVGDSVWLFNSSASALKVYGSTGEAIAVPATGLGTANAAYSQTAQSVVQYLHVTPTQWLINKSA